MNDYTAETGNSRNLRRGAHQLLELYRGHWGQLFWAAFWFTVKHSPAWVTPIVIANIINIVTDPEHHNLTQFWLNLIVGSVFIAQNVLTAWLHTRASSGLTRGVEMELRGAINCSACPSSTTRRPRPGGCCPKSCATSKMSSR